MASSTLLPHFGQYDIEIYPNKQIIRSEYLKHALTRLRERYICNLIHLRMEKNGLNNDRKGHGLTEKRKENLLTAIYIGSVFIILAVIYISHLPSSLWTQIIDFFMSLTLAPVPGTGIVLPAPANPAAHIELYTAGFQFAIALGIIEVVVLLLRVGLRSPVSRKAETIENLVFWLCASYLVTTYLVNMTIAAEWFVFWAGIILIFGLALVARAFVLLAKR
jgi:hypothetical protein